MTVHVTFSEKIVPVYVRFLIGQYTIGVENKVQWRACINFDSFLI